MNPVHRVIPRFCPHMRCILSNSNTPQYLLTMPSFSTNRNIQKGHETRTLSQGALGRDSRQLDQRNTVQPRKRTSRQGLADLGVH